MTGGSPSGDRLLTVRHGDAYGTLHVRVMYASGHAFEVSVIVDVGGGFPSWVRYNFHLQDDSGRCVFRYDNAAHYPELATFPHHKHVGPDEAVEPHPRPSLHQIVAEVEQWTRRRERPDA